MQLSTRRTRCVQVGLGGGITYAFDPIFCDMMAPVFAEAVLACHTTAEASVAKWDAWRLIGQRGGDALCSQPPVAIRVCSVQPLL